MNALPRRLAAVWFADVAGFTHLSSVDEPRALRVMDAMRESVRAAVAAQQGTLVKFLGDGALAEFPSAEGAVEAALEVVVRFKGATRSLEGGPYRLHVGIHVGDVTVAADGDIFGDGVNRAARLQQLAEPGQILVSEEVCRLARSRPEVLFRPEGERTAKGLEQAFPVFSVEARGALAGRLGMLERPAVPAAPQPAPAPPPRLVRSPGAVATGIAAGVMAFGGLAVWTAIGGTEAGRAEDPAVEVGMPLRIALPPPDPAFVLGAWPPAPAATEAAPSAPVERASAAPPDPRVGLIAQAEQVLARGSGRDLTWHEMLPLLRRAVDQMRTEPPGGAQGEALRGLLLFMGAWDHEAAEAAFQSALTADPASGVTRRLYAELLTSQGRAGEALFQLEQARGKGPSEGALEAARGSALFRAGDGRWREAEQALERSLRSEPDVLSTRILLARALTARGETDDALDVLNDIPGALPLVPWMAYARLRGARGEELARARDVVLDVAARAESGYAGAILLAEVGDVERALAALDELIAARDPAVVWIGVDPEWAALRRDPRFRERVARVNRGS